MPYVITFPCIGVKDTACVEVCPVDCIHPRRDEPQYEEVEQLYIDPQTCIDCGACEPVCPVQAIYPDYGVPEDMKQFIEKNKDWYTLPAEEFEKKWGSPGRKG